MRKLLILAAMLLVQTTAKAEVIYRATIDINGRIFNDLMVFDSFPKQMGPQDKRVELKGTLTVPGVFTVPMSGYIEPTLEGFGGSKAVVNITVDEGNGPFTVAYTLMFSLSGLDSFYGTAVLGDGRVLGQLNGKKIFVSTP